MQAQLLDQSCGQELRRRFFEALALLRSQRAEAATAAAQKEAEARDQRRFFQIAEEPTSHEEQTRVWEALLAKISERGEVVFACPMGSQRYNLSTDGSDVDFYIVYRAPTKRLLGLDPPPLTFKNNSNEKPDFTVHELHRYCELLAQSDPRTVETLFLPQESFVHTSPTLTSLQRMRDAFITQELVTKYISDAMGARGSVRAEKRLAKVKEEAAVVPAEHWKLLYIISRLLGGAEQATADGTLTPFRCNESLERRQILALRARWQSTSAPLRSAQRPLKQRSRRTVRDCLQQQTSKHLTNGSCLSGCPHVSHM
eukprot:m.220404 g.220404  ORF g.220404 m.220404 type:complete len:313 (-) comp10799_c0_seq1:1548-2486(-)